MALAEGLTRSALCKKNEITVTRRNITSLSSQAEAGYKASTNNNEAIQNADIVFICVLPQQLNEVLEELLPSVDIKNQLFVSVVTGAFHRSVPA